MPKGVKLYVAGPSKGGPTAEDLAKLSKKFTGKDASPEELEEVRQILAKAEEDYQRGVKDSGQKG